MHVDFEISESDYVAAAQLYHRTRNSVTRILAVLVVASRFLRVAIVLGLVAYADIEDRSLWLVAAIAAVLLVPMTRLYFIRRKLGAIYRANPAIRLEKWLEIDANGIANQGAEGTSLRPWTDFLRVEESRRVFILCMRRSAGYLILPKKHMTSAQRGEFRRMIQENLPNSSLCAVPVAQPQVELTGR
jgi:hypothetical protein